MSQRLAPTYDVYRRISPTNWSPNTGRLETSAYRLRANEQTLSVYHADLQTPRGVLQACLDDQARKLQSADADMRKQAEDFLDANGRTVEELVANLWRVARIPAMALSSLGFQVDNPGDRGHQDVHGTRERFRECSRELRDASTLLSADDCLSGQPHYTR